VDLTYRANSGILCSKTSSDKNSKPTDTEDFEVSRPYKVNKNVSVTDTPHSVPLIRIREVQEIVVVMRSAALAESLHPLRIPLMRLRDNRRRRRSAH